MSSDAGRPEEDYRLGLRALLVQMAPPYGFALASAYTVGYPLAWFTNGAALTLGYLGSLAWVLRFLRRREDAMLGVA